MQDSMNTRSEIWLLGATGTRADHMLANMQLLAQTKEAGVEGVIVDKNNKIRLLEGSYTLKKKDQFGDFVSLIELEAEEGFINIEEGMAFLIESRD